MSKKMKAVFLRHFRSGHRWRRRISALTAACIAILVTGSCSLVDHDSRFDGAPEVLLFDELDQISIDSSRVYVRESEMIGNWLRLEIYHGGGCEEHEYDLFGMTALTTRPTAGHLYLSHDDNGDRCEAIIREILHFDILPLLRTWRSRYDSRMTVPVGIHEPETGDIVATIDVDL